MNPQQRRWDGVDRGPVPLAECDPACRWLETRQHAPGCSLTDPCGGNVKDGPGCSCPPSF